MKERGLNTPRPTNGPNALLTPLPNLGWANPLMYFVVLDFASTSLSHCSSALLFKDSYFEDFSMLSEMPPIE